MGRSLSRTLIEGGSAAVCTTARVPVREVRSARDDRCSDFCVVCICLVSRPVSYVYYLYLQLNMQCTLVGRPVHRTYPKPHRSHRSSIAPHRIIAPRALDSGKYCPDYPTIDHLKRRHRRPGTPGVRAAEPCARRSTRRI